MWMIQLDLSIPVLFVNGRQCYNEWACEVSRYNET